MRLKKNIRFVLVCVYFVLVFMFMLGSVILHSATAGAVQLVHAFVLRCYLQTDVYLRGRALETDHNYKILINTSSTLCELASCG